MNTKTTTEQEHSPDTKHAKHVNLERLLQFQHGLDIYIMSHTYILYTGQIANNKEQFYMWWLNFLCYHGNRLSSITHCSGPRWKPQLQIKPEQSPHLGLLVKSPLNVSYLSLKHLLFFFKRPNHILICLEYESAVDLRYEKTTQWILIGYLGLLVQPPLHVPQLVHQHVLLLLQGAYHVGVGLVLCQKTQHLTRNSHVTHKRFAWHRIYTQLSIQEQKWFTLTFILIKKSRNFKKIKARLVEKNTYIG